jgi:hypothetical protein
MRLFCSLYGTPYFFVKKTPPGELTERTYGRDETRNQTWYSVVMAKILMGLKAYPFCTIGVKQRVQALVEIVGLIVVKDDRFLCWLLIRERRPVLDRRRDQFKHNIEKERVYYGGI